MEIDFPQKMSAKSDEDLLAIIDSRSKYVPDAIKAAVAELQNRGHIFLMDELSSIQADIELKVRKENYSNDIEYTYSDDMSIFPDNEIVSYYSKRAVMGFSFFFGVLAGAVLFAINVRKNKRHLLIVSCFGVACTALILFLAGELPGTNGLGYLFNIAGGFVLTGIFWPKYIGDNVKYKSRSIWVPLVIALAFEFAILFYIFFIGW